MNLTPKKNGLSNSYNSYIIIPLYYQLYKYQFKILSIDYYEFIN